MVAGAGEGAAGGAEGGAAVVVAAVVMVTVAAVVREVEEVELAMHSRRENAVAETRAGFRTSLRSEKRVSTVVLRAHTVRHGGVRSNPPG